LVVRGARDFASAVFLRIVRVRGEGRAQAVSPCPAWR
jgi:hypothetical protein